MRLAGIVFLDAAERHNMIIAMLATIVVVLLFSPVKSAIQNALDRAFYRDKYDYRRALVGFARDLNSDLDLDRLGERLVARIRETFVIDRMALLLVDEGVRQLRGDSRRRVWRLAGVRLEPALAACRQPGAAAWRCRSTIPRLQGAFPPEEIALWRLRGVHYFVPCVSKGGTIAVLALGQRGQGEPLSSEDMGLLSAVGSHVATALENGRLYRQLQLKAGELQRLQEFNENIVESLDDGLVVEDLDGRVLRWNRALADIYGLSATEAIGHKLEEVFDGPFVEALRAAQREAPDGASLYRVPLAGRAAKAGERLRVNIATAPLKAPSGQFSMSTVGNIIIIEDVTERVHLEEQLQISDKMASVGLLAAGVAHEVNTPLTGISSFTQMLLSNADPDDPKTRMLEKIEQQTFRAAKIVNGLLNLSRSSGSNTEENVPVDLNAVIGDVLVAARASAHGGQGEGAARAVPVAGARRGHRAQAAAGVSEPVPECTRRDAERRLAVGRDAARRTGTSSQKSADTGSGIPSEHLSRIYDPFFTTKADRQGNRARPVHYLRHRPRARGHADVPERSWTGHAIHRVAACIDRGRATGRGQELSEIMQKNGSILVVDDEEIMREILETLLKGEGYSVRLAASGEEGIELARNIPFDAAIVDVMMPGIDGMTTLESLKKLDDELAVIMVTAYRIGGERHHRDEARSVRLHHQAVQERRGAGRHQERARAAAAGQREPHASAEHPGAVQPLRQHRRPRPGDAARIRPDHPGGAEPVDDPDSGRKRHGEGARRAGHSHAFAAEGPRVRHGQLRQPAARPPGIDALRPREGRVHRSRVSQERALRSRRQGAASSSTRSATSRSRRRPSCCA